MNDTCATHRSRVPRRSFGRNKRRSDDIGRRERTRPGFYFMFCVWQSSVRGCRFSVMFVYFVIKMLKCSPVPASFFPYITNFITPILGQGSYRASRIPRATQTWQQCPHTTIEKSKPYTDIPWCIFQAYCGIVNICFLSFPWHTTNHQFLSRQLKVADRFEKLIMQWCVNKKKFCAFPTRDWNGRKRDNCFNYSSSCE